MRTEKIIKMQYNETITNVLEFLENAGIEYEIHTHPPLPTIEIAMEYWKEIDSTHCKNLFFRNHKGNRHYLVCFECHNNLDIRSLELALKQGKLSFASPERMQRCLGLTPGSVSLFGLINDMGLKNRTNVNPKELFPNGHRVKLYLDNDLKQSKKISFHPCDNTASVTISQEGFRRFLELWGGEVEWIEVQEDLE